MPADTMVRLAANYGLSVVLSIGILMLCVWIVKFIVNKISVQIDGQTRIVESLNMRIEGSINSQTEAHKYQRDEHKEMLTGLQEVVLTLQGMNGNSKKGRR